jgi:hypothetical protein
MVIRVKIERTLSVDFVSDILITAFDGNYGGCWQWAEPSNDDWLTALPDGTWTKVEVRPKEETGIPHLDNLTRQNGGITVDDTTIQIGLQKIIDGEFLINDALRDHILRGVLEEDAGEIDSIAADCIVQAGWFGTLVFG